jgi:multiple sugar transport system permease protein
MRLSINKTRIPLSKAEKKKERKEIILNIISIITCAAFLFPLYWLLATSFKSEFEVFSTPPTLIPASFNLEAYIAQLKPGEVNILRSFLNSFIISGGSTVISTVLAIPAAYGLARFHIRGKKLFIFAFLVTQMMPASLILTPLFIMFNEMNLINTYMSAIIACSTASVPYTILILRTFFLAIPKELEESAKIDGCNALTAFIRIIIPVAIPAVVVGIVFSFLMAWGNLVYGLTFINNAEMRPITVGIYNSMQQYGTMWNQVMAFGTIAVLPVVVIFVFMQKYIVSGLTNGAVKG